ncbi:MAG: tail fiber domain-containing protein, partial [Candidatus Fonsibacter sp.]
AASDNRLKYNEKPLTNALDVINQFEPVEDDQTHDLVDQYTANTPESHQCGFVAQSVQSIDELKHAVVGGQVGDDGKESIRAQLQRDLHIRRKSNTRVEPTSEGSTGENKRTTCTDQNHLLMNSATIIS